jgi:hypothetical protein
MLDNRSHLLLFSECIAFKLENGVVVNTPWSDSQKGTVAPLLLELKIFSLFGILIGIYFINLPHKSK